MATMTATPPFTGRRQQDDDQNNGLVIAGLLFMLAGGLLFETRKRTVTTCSPACPPGTTCGPGNVCLCGSAPCPAGSTCNSGVCVTPPTCGTCPPGQTCDEVTGACVPAPASGGCAHGPNDCPGSGCTCPANLEGNTNCALCYEIKGGDTLISIIQRAYGTQVAPNGLVIWESIYNKNAKTITACAQSHGFGSDYWDHIFPGERICLPVFDGIVPQPA